MEHRRRSIISAPAPVRSATGSAFSPRGRSAKLESVDPTFAHAESVEPDADTALRQIPGFWTNFKNGLTFGHPSWLARDGHGNPAGAFRRLASIGARRPWRKRSGLSEAERAVARKWARAIRATRTGGNFAFGSVLALLFAATDGILRLAYWGIQGFGPWKSYHWFTWVKLSVGLVVLFGYLNSMRHDEYDTPFERVHDKPYRWPCILLILGLVMLEYPHTLASGVEYLRGIDVGQFLAMTIKPDQ